MRNKLFNIFLAAFVLVSLRFLFTPSVASAPIPHHCNWGYWDDEQKEVPCKYAGHTEFFTDYEEGTDGYYFDLTHFTHPELTPDECEDFVMSSASNTKAL